MYEGSVPNSDHLRLMVCCSFGLVEILLYRVLLYILQFHLYIQFTFDIWRNLQLHTSTSLLVFFLPSQTKQTRWQKSTER